MSKGIIQLVSGDGELAGIFQQHGRPVAADSLQELSRNKPFNKLHTVLDKVSLSSKNPWLLPIIAYATIETITGPHDHGQSHNQQEGGHAAGQPLIGLFFSIGTCIRNKRGGGDNPS